MTSDGTHFVPAETTSPNSGGPQEKQKLFIIYIHISGQRFQETWKHMFIRRSETIRGSATRNLGCLLRHLMARERVVKDGGKATAGKSSKVNAKAKDGGKVTAGKSRKVKEKGAKAAETKSGEQEQGQHGQIASSDSFIQQARAAYEREQERIRRNEPTRAEQKIRQDRRMAAWIKENPGKTKYHYVKHRNEQFKKQIAGIRAQTKFLQMRRSQNNTRVRAGTKN